jgi:hypothetical protein
MVSPTTTLERLRHYLRQNQSRLRAAPTQAEQLDMLAQIQQPSDDYSVASLRVVEHAEMRAIPVRPVSQPNALKHFLDGIQRQRILYYDGVVPVFYAYLSAVVRSRVDRRMCCLPQTASWMQRDALYAPLRYVDAQGLRQQGIPLRDLEVGEPLPPHPTLIQLAANRISNDREILERELAEQWIYWLSEQSSEDWLVVDGAIAELVRIVPSAKVIGLAKTSVGVERALTPEQMQVVYGLRKAERSSVFTVTRPGQATVYSWFLRLHDPTKGSLLYGLLRVEMTANESLLKQVDTLSAWILEDRVPLAVPDTRYDRLLYPMRDCEQYLRAHAPSAAQLEALAQLV